MVFGVRARYPSAMIITALLIAAAVPHPAELKTFQDWTVGCDNGGACHAVALMPEDWPDDALTMSVRREAGTDAPPVVAFELGADSRASALVADGRTLGIRLSASGDLVAVVPADVAAIIGALRSAGRLEVRAADGRAPGNA